MASGNPRCPNCGWGIGDPVVGHASSPRDWSALFDQLQSMDDADLYLVVHHLSPSAKRTLRKHLLGITGGTADIQDAV